MKVFCSIFLAVSILINSGSGSAFQKKLQLRGVSDAKGYPGAFVSRNYPPRINTNLFVSSSSKPSDFSPDNKAQRKSHHYSLGPRHYPPLHSSIPVDHDPNGMRNPVTRVAQNAWSSVSDRFSLLDTRGGILQKQKRRKSFHELNRTGPRSVGATLSPARTIRTSNASVTKTAKKGGISKVDVAIFVTYFCNISILTLGVLTVPAIAAEHNLGPHATAAFCASMASLAPLGGFVGKLVNGFVCQKFGGQRSSYMYLLLLSSLSLGISFTTSLAPVGLFLVGIDFLSSIQWTAICAVLDQNYRQKPKLRARGITILSISSTMGALFAKTAGSGLLQATEWRTVYRCGAMAALLGAAAIYVGGSAPKSLFENRGSVISGPKAATRVSAGGQQEQSPLSSLKNVLSSPIFWMIGMGHTVGHVARVSDKLLGPFLQEVGGISSSMAVGLTSSVTIGFVLGLFKGTMFNKMQSLKGKMKMIRSSYTVAILSTLGLATCGIKSVSNLLSPNMIMAAITIFSGLIATSVSFLFYNIPNLMSTSIFPESTSVALSLIDAVGFLVTAGVMGVSSLVLGAFGWSATWAFIALFFSIGGTSMMRAMTPVLIENAKNQRRQS